METQEWENRIDLIWDRAEMPTWATDAKTATKALFRATLEKERKQVRVKTLEEVEAGLPATKSEECSLFEAFGYHSKDCWDGCMAASTHNAALSAVRTLIGNLKAK